jgi:hypothetical protein
METSNYYKSIPYTYEFCCYITLEFLDTEEFLKYIISMFYVIMGKEIRGEMDKEWHAKVSVSGIKLKNP